MEDRRDENKSRRPVHCDATPTLDYILLCFSRQTEVSRALSLNDRVSGHGLVLSRFYPQPSMTPAWSCVLGRVCGIWAI